MSPEVGGALAPSWPGWYCPRPAPVVTARAVYTDKWDFSVLELLALHLCSRLTFVTLWGAVSHRTGVSQGQAWWRATGGPATTWGRKDSLVRGEPLPELTSRARAQE